ncbi:chromosome replication/partitioning protein [Borreliella burgdorferi]|uniref:chromosome replication/partitioning protein n=1 Tax=Borreliella burgdorferi TaxID=139 RepID=UPI001E4A72AE|nr:chromosome replication/partitioning protein [Borreliella burgdorferi]MCD2387444.1 chromosome replication/partitioning protein [Borreliella burgdorferi]
MNKKNINLKINKRISENNLNYILDQSNENQRKEEFERLITQLKNNIKSEIYNIIDTMKILKKINDKRLYLEGGYKSFKDFLSDFKLAKTQSYEYIKLAAAIEAGILEENFITNNGIRASIRYIKNQANGTIKKSKQNPIKPLRFQLKKQESYDFYKKNAKFTSFMMDEIFENQKDFLNKLLKKYKELKGQ